MLSFKSNKIWPENQSLTYNRIALFEEFKLKTDKK